jgi:hypothetical protein
MLRDVQSPPREGDGGMVASGGVVGVGGACAPAAVDVAHSRAVRRRECFLDMRDNERRKPTFPGEKLNPRELPLGYDLT